MAGTHTAVATPGVASSLSLGARPALAVRPSRALRITRVGWGGWGRIWGHTYIHGTPDVPARLRVRLVRDNDGACVGETWSDASTGTYEFTGVDPRVTYTVLVYDHTATWRVGAVDRRVAEPYP